MILYFSGTGNSKYVAEANRRRAGRCACESERPHQGFRHFARRNRRASYYRHADLCWRIPRVVRDWLLKTELRGAKQVWFVMTCGSEIGNADKYNRELCTEKAISCMGTAQIVMPENYIAMFSAPQADEARQIVAKAEPNIDCVIASIQNNQPFAPTRNNLYDRFMSGAVNPIFYKFFVKADAFTVSGSCIGCGQCVKRCPMNNVALKDGKPVWGKVCTHCMACICYCPVSAIEYGKKSVGQPRYHFEAL